MFQVLKLRKKVKRQKKKVEDELQWEKKTKTENCDTRTYDVIRRNFEKSSNREINIYIALVLYYAIREIFSFILDF